MKKFLTTAILLAMFTTWSTMMAQPHQEEYLGLPGDNLNLYAVMKLFQESETLESFERNLNDENTRINNLDLNGDNFIDYIRVKDYVDRDVHNIVLQVPVNNRETQDVAVFTVQRFPNGQVQIQLIGDEALYGKNYIIEPMDDEQYANQTPNPGYTGNPSGNISVVRTTYIDIAAWPVVRFMYMPNYVVWQSDWHWGYYPTYWHPWQPYYWHFYYGYHYNWYDNYYRHYHRCDYPRYSNWNNFYYSNRRSHSPYVSERIHSGHYRTTYSHPDQRRKGEALYASTNHDQINRRAVQNPENSTARREVSRRDQNTHATATSSSTSRRNNTSVSRSAANPAKEHNTASARRSATTGKQNFTTTPAKETNTSRSSVSSTNRTASPGTANHNSGTARKSASNVSSRSTSTQPKGNNSFSERKSSTNPRPSSGTVQSRSTSRKATSGESVSNRRSNGQNQSVKTSKSNSNKESAEKTKNTKRR